MEKFIGYVAKFILVDEGNYFVEFPDLPGCLTQGTSLEMAICNAQDALAIYYQEKEGKLPIASDLAEIQRKNSDVITQIIAIDTNNYIVKTSQTIKKTLTIPKWLNDLSIKYDVNFSQILKDALINHLKKLGRISSYDKNFLE